MNDARMHRPPIWDVASLDEHYAPASYSAIRGGLRRLRAIRRIALTCVWTLVASVPQTILIRSTGKSKIRFARYYWASVCRILGLRVRVVGTVAGTIRDAQAVTLGQKPVIFVANHSSWLDIAVVGGILPTVFVAKQQIADWPIIGTLARLGRTIFVSRQRNNTGRELRAMTERLANGDNLILFPEGTSTDGSRVLPFLSSFFAIAKPSRQDPDGVPPPPPVLIQPISIVYDRLEGLPVGRARRTAFAWYGDMELAPHIWKVTQWRSMRASIILHPPIAPESCRTRKDLSALVHQVISKGVADLHQNPEMDR